MDAIFIQIIQHEDVDRVIVRYRYSDHDMEYQHT